MSATPTTSVDASAAPSVAVSRGLAPSWRWVTAVVLLFGGAAALLTLAPWLEWYFEKQPVPLKKPLAQFNDAALGWPYEKAPLQPRPIDADTLQSLGTEELLQRLIIDRSAAPTDPTSLASLFVTYYTGKPDLVPHVPDECYLAGGYERIGPSEDEEIEVPGIGAPNDKLNVRVIEFRDKQLGAVVGDEAPTFTVMYFFLANNEYCTTRNGVRVLMSDLRARYAYYAKFEVRFVSRDGARGADREASLAALERMLARLMPVMFEQHLADWDELLKQGEAGDAASRRAGSAGEI